MLSPLYPSAPNHVLSQAIKCVLWGTHGYFVLTKYQVHKSIYPPTISVIHESFRLAFFVCLAAVLCVIFWAASENRKLDQEKARLRASLYASPTAERLAQSPKRLSFLVDEEDQLSEVSTCVTSPHGLLSSRSFSDTDSEPAFRPTRRACPAPSDWSASTESHLIAQPLFTMELLSKYPSLVNFQTILISGLLLSLIGALMTTDTQRHSLLISILLASTLFVTLSNTWEVLKCLWICLREPFVLSASVRQERIALWSYLAIEAFVIWAVLSSIVNLAESAMLLIMGVPYLYGMLLYTFLSCWMFASPFLPRLAFSGNAIKSSSIL
eukprot:Blabericola_migrator_1__8420@NODE_438_length_8472_cov_502_790006_g344_i0_p2_GENE_NODE_438_length_8472_cov_502_790006_g344_i0NODE_438_length_8472_cov_502_790006_g344_i0_p2_ORF_typecomplete_len325_score29_61Nucleos_tra2_N/PF01773_20/20Nucleos_tra2_N/PF01773_20/13FtsL/PF04999_13/1_5FtsL/PF04999_13/9_3e02_NODE_438_length_8472_cov_502_790006_g344_i074428416